MPIIQYNYYKYIDYIFCLMVMYVFLDVADALSDMI